MSQRQISSSGGSHAVTTRQSVRRRMTWDRSLPDDVVAALWESPESVLRRGSSLQTKSRTTVACVDFASGSYLLKYHHWAGSWKTLSKSLAISPNRRSFDDGWKLASGGVPTPLPLACVDVRLGPLNSCSYLLTEFVSGTSLYRTMRYGEPDASAVDCFARQVADIWQLLDDLQYCHNDLKPENLMIDNNDRVWLIDLENGRWHSDRQSLRPFQVEDAKRLLHVRSWQAVPQAAEQFRRRLLETSAVQTALAHSDNQLHPLTSAASIGGDAPQRLTVLIPCHNSVEDIRGCIEAVRDFADEILVVDDGSNDGTWELLQNLPHSRAMRIDSLDVDMQRRAIAAASHPWILQIDPTERVSSDLAKEIQFLLAGNQTSDGFRIARRCRFFGKVIRFGDFAGDMPVRLFRRDSQVRPESDRFDVRNPQDRVRKLRCTIEYDVSNIKQLVAPASESACGAQELQARDRQPSLASVLFHAPLRFVRSYFMKLGFLDGLAGLQLAILSAASVYVRYAKLCQVQHGLPQLDAPVDPDICRTIEERSNGEQHKAA